MREFTVKRSEWLRGEGHEKSRLLRTSDGKKCCLGFLGLSCGYSARALSDQGSPDFVIMKNQNLWPSGMINYFNSNSDTCRLIMEVNDAKFLSDDVREQTLQKHFKSIGIEIHFED